MDKAKREMRLKMLALRKGLSGEALRNISLGVVSNILSSHEYLKAKAVFMYAPVRNEADIMPVFKRAVIDKKTVLFPRVTDSCHMEFFEADSLDDLEKGYMGILEPRERCRRRSLYDSALMLVPGAAFDRNGGRLGMGGGYYDRFMAENRMNILFAGIAGEYQLADNVPMEENDIYMDMIITEKGIYKKS